MSETSETSEKSLRSEATAEPEPCKALASRGFDKSVKQKNQLESYPKAQDWYDYKGYEPELYEEKTTTTTSKQPLPQDISQIFNHLNTTGLSYHRDPLCVDQNYTKHKYRFSVLPKEERVPGTPEEIQDKYTLWFVNDWKQRSRLSKILSILWYLPGHLYRKYFATTDYLFYYRGLLSFLDRTRQKIL